MTVDQATDPVELALAYHERTKHHFHRFAASLGHLDWDTQPDPFRRYEGAPLVELPLPAEDRTPAYDALYERDAVPPQSVTRETLSTFFFYSLALSAWKQYGADRWSLRCNPSSGNLHPTEGYLVGGPVDGLSDAPAVYHYAPKEHGLERRAALLPEAWQGLAAQLPRGAFLVGLSSIHWRESWKYGERAWRYCQHDAGHALAALRLAAALVGWRLTLLPAPGSGQIARLLGLDRRDEFIEGERETADALAAVCPSGEPFSPDGFSLDEAALDRLAAARWLGRANRLSREHQDWPVIDTVDRACRKPPGLGDVPPAQGKAWPPAPSAAAGEVSLTGGAVIRRRRSAVAMDGVTALARERFYALLARLLPDVTSSPWDAVPWPPQVHLGLFVHRVDGLAPGLYLLVRNEDHMPELRGELRAEFAWRAPAGCPAGLPLYLLAEGDVRGVAAQVSCGQDIAGDGVFSAGLLARFEPVLRACGAWLYPRLFWETGMIGQVLYLEAEAANLRGTGIGCFFDDPVHEVFGLATRRYQSLYHFTVGGPVEDPRLSTLPAYPPERGTSVP